MYHCHRIITHSQEEGHDTYLDRHISVIPSRSLLLHSEIAMAKTNLFNLNGKNDRIVFSLCGARTSKLGKKEKGLQC